MLIVIALGLVIQTEKQFRPKSISIIILITIILPYPIYTIGFKSNILGLIGNTGIFIYCVILITFSGESSLTAVLLFNPVLVWLSAASFYAILVILVE